MVTLLVVGLQPGTPVDPHPLLISCKEGLVEARVDWEEVGGGRKGSFSQREGQGPQDKESPSPKPCVTLGSSLLSGLQCPPLCDILSCHRVIALLLRWPRTGGEFMVVQPIFEKGGGRRWRWGGV